MEMMGNGFLARYLNRHSTDKWRLWFLMKRFWGDQHTCLNKTEGAVNRRKGRQVAMSDREWTLLQERAAEVGMSAAEFVRTMCGLRPRNRAECAGGYCREQELRRKAWRNEVDAAVYHPEGCRCQPCRVLETARLVRDNTEAAERLHRLQTKQNEPPPRLSPEVIEADRRLSGK